MPEEQAVRFDRLITFASVHHSIRAEQNLLKAGLLVEAIPTPRQVDVSCGQSLLFLSGQQESVMSLLTDQKIRWSKLFSRDDSGKIYEKLADCGG